MELVTESSLNTNSIGSKKEYNSLRRFSRGVKNLNYFDAL